jgi:hypothetical protein
MQRKSINVPGQGANSFLAAPLDYVTGVWFAFVLGLFVLCFSVDELMTILKVER